MRGLWFEEGSARLREDLPEPEVRPGEALVQVLRAGLCATDLALLRGYMGFRGVPGHEFVGRALSGSHRGRRVVGEINAGCGLCADCRGGRERHCAERTVLGILGRSGAFAERLSLPERNLHPLPEGLETDRAVFAEPLAAAFEIAEQIDLGAVRRALVVGDGRLGLLCTQVLALAGIAEVVLLGRHPERASMLPQGVAFRREPPDRPFPLVVEATGKPEVFQRALGWVEPRGTLVLKTTAERATPLDLTDLVVNEIQVIGSRCGPFGPALAALEHGRVDVAPMIQGRFPLEQGQRALERAGQRGVLKILLDMESE